MKKEIVFQKVKNIDRKHKVMEIKIQERKDDFLIEIQSEETLALAVYTEGQERIYLPQKGVSDSTYYVERSEALIETDKGYELRLDERPQDIEIIN